ncbi:MAG: 3-phosphoserine/phosphohydroxythreonine transaminase [Oscillospiraceae bacterium]|nr:3-phosphoserine/phosphohydroxythreonine transaminase [Oscillospiraceae bacterium]
MFTERIYNFSAGPSMLPEAVLAKAQSKMLNFGGSGTSVMEMSHRSKAFVDIFDETKTLLKALMGVPDSHEILFLQGGASLQFAMVPLNLIGKTGKADYAVTGNFSNLAMKEAKHYGEIHEAASSADQNHTYIPAQDQLNLSKDAAYFHYCDNNTIYGTEWNYVPDTGAVPLVSDMSSNILSKPMDVSKYGLIYAGAQKNMAPAGLTVVILDKSLLGLELSHTPTMLRYQTHVDADSMYNTPPTYNIYMLGLVLNWIEARGGLTAMERYNEEKAAILYDYLDESALFKACALPEFRSKMNVTFVTGDPDLDAKFAKEAGAAGLSNLKGHRVVGGMRASIYNAMPMEGVSALVEFMKEFEQNNR